MIVLKDRYSNNFKNSFNEHCNCQFCSIILITSNLFMQKDDSLAFLRDNVYHYNACYRV